MGDLNVLGRALQARDAQGPHSPVRFGQYRGRPIGQLPSDYLQWCLNHVQLSHDNRYQVQQELLRRV